MLDGAGCDAVGVADSFAQRGLAAAIKFDWEILEAHVSYLVIRAVIGMLDLAIEPMEGLLGTDRLFLVSSPTTGRLIAIPSSRSLFVVHRQTTDPADKAANRSARGGTKERAGRSGVERSELVGETRHRAADANATHIHTTAIAIDDAPLRDVALHDWTPATQFYEAFLITVLFGEDALLVVAGTRTVTMHGLGEQPGGATKLVELRQGRQAVEKEQRS